MPHYVVVSIQPVAPFDVMAGWEYSAREAVDKAACLQGFGMHTELLFAVNQQKFKILETLCCPAMLSPKSDTLEKRVAEIRKWIARVADSFLQESLEHPPAYRFDS